jgi:hypothetical protein
MEIIKDLKYAKFIYNNVDNEFEITVFEQFPGETPDVMPTTIKLSKTYAFSLMRFLIRIAQRNFLRRKK